MTEINKNLEKDKKQTVEQGREHMTDVGRKQEQQKDEDKSTESA